MTAPAHGGFVRGRGMVDRVADALDMPPAEAGLGLPRPLGVGFHPWTVEPPSLFGAFRAVLDLLPARCDRLWLARRADVAGAFAGAVPRP